MLSHPQESETWRKIRIQFVPDARIRQNSRNPEANLNSIMIHLSGAVNSVNYRRRYALPHCSMLTDGNDDKIRHWVTIHFCSNIFVVPKHNKLYGIREKFGEMLILFLKISPQAEISQKSRCNCYKLKGFDQKCSDFTKIIFQCMYYHPVKH